MLPAHMSKNINTLQIVCVTLLISFQFVVVTVGISSEPETTGGRVPKQFYI